MTERTPKDQNPCGNQVSNKKKSPCLPLFAPNTGIFRDPLIGQRGRRPNHWPWLDKDSRSVAKVIRVFKEHLEAVLNEAGADCWHWQIIDVDTAEVTVVFSKSFFRRHEP